MKAAEKIYNAKYYQEHKAKILAKAKERAGDIAEDAVSAGKSAVNNGRSAMEKAQERVNKAKSSLTNSAKNLTNSAADRVSETSRMVGKKAKDALLSEKTQQFMNDLSEANESRERAHKRAYERNYQLHRNIRRFR